MATLTSTSATYGGAEITAAALALNAVTDSKVYDATTGSSGTVAKVGLQGSDSVTSLTQSYQSKNVLGANASTLQVTAGYVVDDGNSGNNYTVTTNTAAGTITAAALALNAVTDSKVYDGGTSSSGVVSVGTTYGTDTVSGALQAFSSKNVLGTNGSTINVTGYTVNDGNNGNNYTVTTNTAAGTITAAALTLNAVTDSKVYDATTGSSGTVAKVGLQGSDSVTSLTQSYQSKNVLGANASTLQVTAGYVVDDGNSGNNYTVTTNTAAGTITAAALALNAVTDSKVYDATTGSSGMVAKVGLQGSDSVTSLTQSYQSKNVLGSNLSTLEVAAGYTVNDGNSGNNYTVTTNTAAGTITKAALAINAVTDSKVYDGGTSSSGAVSVGTTYGTDTVSGALQAFSTKNVLGTNGSTLNVTGYTVNDGNSGNNYTVTTNTAAGTITAAALALNAVTDSKVYDATTGSSGTVAKVGLQGSDSVTSLTQSYQSKNVLGSNLSTLEVAAGYTVNDGNSGNNYTVTTNTAAGTITAAALALNAVTDSKVYDATTGSSGTVAKVGLQGSDSVTSLTQSYQSKNVLGSNLSTLEVAAGYTVNDGNSGNNYTVTTNTAAGTITAAALALNAVTDSKVYDGGTSSSGAVSVGTTYGTDTVSGALQAFSSKNVLGTNGSTLNVTGYTVNDGNSGNNYTVTTNTAAGTITKAALAINAVTDSKVYDGGTSSSGAVSVGTTYGTDTVSGALQAFSSKNVLGTNGSTLNVTGYTVNDGNSGNNYTVTTNTAAGTITAAALALNAVTDSKVYDATTGSSGTVAKVGLQGSDSVTSLTQSYQSKNVLGSNLSTLEVAAGYTVNDGNSGNNYTVTTNTAAGTITAAALALNAVTDSKVYDATTGSSGTVAKVGLQGSDSVTSLTQSYQSKNVLGSNLSTLEVAAGYTVNDGNSGNNYTVTTNTAAGTITAALALNAVTDSKVYDATTGSSGTVAKVGLQGSDSVTSLTQSYQSKNVLGSNLSTLGSGDRLHGQ
ncbi:MAG: hypothetical protein IPO13_04975 [Rhodocyclaceae bacterium]|nr:hypothetical protein [Rhodocyclaceae bacterium]